MLDLFLGARGETRTLTPVKVADFESAASTIPPLGLLKLKTNINIARLIILYQVFNPIFGLAKHMYLIFIPGSKPISRSLADPEFINLAV